MNFFIYTRGVTSSLAKSGGGLCPPSKKSGGAFAPFAYPIPPPMSQVLSPNHKPVLDTHGIPSWILASFENGILIFKKSQLVYIHAYVHTFSVHEPPVKCWCYVYCRA